MQPVRAHSPRCKIPGTRRDPAENPAGRQARASLSHGSRPRPRMSLDSAVIHGAKICFEPTWRGEMARRGVLRRDVLKGLAALVPLSMGVGLRPVLAGTAPKRIVFFFIPDGCIPGLFHPKGTEFSFELSPMTKALEPVK